MLCGNSEVEQQVAMLGLDPELGRGELFGELLPACARARRRRRALRPLRALRRRAAVPPRPRRSPTTTASAATARPLADARLAEVRFAAECLAFANVPEQAGVEAVLPGAPADVVVHHPRWKAGVPRDAGTGWDFDDVRDHYLRELFGVDPGELRRYDHERYLELSRAVSGEVMAAVFGEWRRAGSPCGGGLVLWLRDLVAGRRLGPGRRRRRAEAALPAPAPALAPTAVWMTDEGLGGVGVHVANDGPEPLARPPAGRPLPRPQAAVGEAERGASSSPAHGALARDLEAMLGRFVDASWAYRFGPPAQDAIVATLEPLDGSEAAGDGEAIARAVHFPAGRPSGAETPARLGVEASATRDAHGDVVLTVNSQRLLYGLMASAKGARAEQPWTFVEPGIERRLLLRSRPGGDEAGTVVLAALNMSGRASATIA